LEKNKLTKSYKDGILDCLNIIIEYQMVGIYDVPIRYIEEAIMKLLPTDPKELKPDITKDLKKSREVLDEGEYMLGLSQ
jgi:hypothetical protein